MKKRLISAGSVLLTLFILTITIYAAEVPDLSRTGSISINTTYQEQIVPGGSLTLYRVAEVHRVGADYGFRYVESYADCQVSLNQLSSAKTARDLADYTSVNAIEGVVGAIDAQGHVSFEDLELGLYLLVQEEAAEGYRAVSPFLVTVPGREGDEYIYNVNASPKLELQPIPDTPDEPDEPDKPDEPDEPDKPDEPDVPDVPDEPDKPDVPDVPDEPDEPDVPDEPKLPQTGLTNWPIPVLAVSGAFLVALGWYLHATGRKRSNEG